MGCDAVRPASVCSHVRTYGADKKGYCLLLGMMLRSEQLMSRGVLPCYIASALLFCFLVYIILILRSKQFLIVRGVYVSSIKSKRAPSETAAATYIHIFVGGFGVWSGGRTLAFSLRRKRNLLFRGAMRRHEADKCVCVCVCFREQQVTAVCLCSTRVSTKSPTNQSTRLKHFALANQPLPVPAACALRCSAMLFEPTSWKHR